MKRNLILILAIIICASIVIILITSGKNKNEAENVTNNQDSKATGTNLISDLDARMSYFDALLKDSGFSLENKEEIYSEEINEEGYSYDFNGEIIEVYPVDIEKINHLLISSNGSEVRIRTMTSEVEGIYYKEYLILNCIQNKDKLLGILQ